METLTVGPLQSGKFPNPPYLVEKIETGEQEDSDGNSEERTEWGTSEKRETTSETKESEKQKKFQNDRE